MVFPAVARHFSKTWAMFLEQKPYLRRSQKSDAYENRNGSRKDFTSSGVCAVDEVAYAHGDLDQNDGCESLGAFCQTKRMEV